MRPVPALAVVLVSLFASFVLPGASADDHVVVSKTEDCPPSLLGPCSITIRLDVHKNFGTGCYSDGCWTEQHCSGHALATLDPTWYAEFNCTDPFPWTATERCPSSTQEKTLGECSRGPFETYSGAGIFVYKGTCRVFSMTGFLYSPARGAGASASLSVQACHRSDGTYEILWR